MNKIIEAQNIVKEFKGEKALNNISFSVSEGEIFGFLGPSGAGKTTTINILTGQVIANQGKAFILGNESDKISRNTLLHIGIMSDTVGFYGKMSLYKNLAFFAKFHQIPLNELDRLLEELGLLADKNKQAEKLSTGMKQRMLLIRAILHTPKVLFLDEPTSGLDPTLSQKVHHILWKLKQNGTTIFLTTHNMQEAKQMCDNIALLYKGQIIEYGPPQAIIDKYSEEDKVMIRFKTGRKMIVPKEETYKYLGSEVASIHSLESSLETIFIQLTGEEFENE